MSVSHTTRRIAAAAAGAALLAGGVLIQPWTADAAADVPTQLNGYALSEAERSNMRLLVDRADELPGDHEQRAHTLAVATWWAIKEGPLSIPASDIYNNCHENGADHRGGDGDPLFECNDPAGTDIWQVGIHGVQVAAVSADQVSTLLPGSSVDDALVASLSDHGVDPEGETGQAVRNGSQRLQQGWLARHAVLGTVAVAQAAEAECLSGAEASWCFSTGTATWPSQDRYAPDLATSLAVVSELEQAYADMLDGVAADAPAETPVEDAPTTSVPTADTATAQATVLNTGGIGLNVRAASSTSSEVVGFLQTGEQVTITCQMVGDAVHNGIAGWTTDLWNRTDAGAYVADSWLDTGHSYRIPGIPDCADLDSGVEPTAEPTTEPTTKPTAEPTPEPTAEPTTNPTTQPGGSLMVPPGELVAVRQGQGHYSQWADCGPTSAVVVTLAMGITPEGWDPNAPVHAIQAMREPAHMNVSADAHVNGTSSAEVAAGLASYGISTREAHTTDEILSAAQQGKPSVINGMTAVFPWQQDLSDPSYQVAHWVALLGYDAGTGEYLVVDPVSSVDANQVHRATEDQVRAYIEARGWSLGVIAE